MFIAHAVLLASYFPVSGVSVTLWIASQNSASGLASAEFACSAFVYILLVLGRFLFVLLVLGGVKVRS